jgi:hypothetical protein
MADSAIQTGKGRWIVAVKKPPLGKKYFTVAEANTMLPLVRAIVQDITQLDRDLRERSERLARLRPSERITIADPYHEEMQQVQAEFERDRERMDEYFQELRRLGIELKDPQTGLIDFPARMEGRDVYLCWRLGEPEVGYWHDLQAGFAGRQKIQRSGSRFQPSDS